MFISRQISAVSRQIVWHVVLLMTIGMTACRPGSGMDEGVTTRYKVALIMPQPQWESERAIVSGALASMDKAQRGMTQRVALDVEWIDEEAANLSDEVYRVANSGDYAAIVGPKYSRHARMVATASLDSRIPVLMPSVTSADVQRIYAGSNKNKPNIFCMSESDLAQTQAMLNILRKQFLTSRIILLSRGGNADDYVSSFTAYMPYFATELRFKGVEELTFSDKESLRAALLQIRDREAWDIFSSTIFFIPSTIEDMLMIDAVLTEEGITPGINLVGEIQLVDANIYPGIFCPDLACNVLLENNLTHEFEGIALCGNPESGFPAARKAQTGKEIQSGYAQLYDCFTLLGLALAHKETAKLPTLREAIVAVMDACDGNGDEFAWTEDGLRYGFRSIRDGRIPVMAGASGCWVFDRETHISQLGSWYGHWRYYDGQYHLVEYMTRSDHARQAGMDQMWEWSTDVPLTFGDETKHIPYEPLQDRYAVVMATSTGWNNYRHQADALDIYRMLRNAGYDDAHIVLITEDDLADNPQNPHPGVVHVTPDGENLHANIVNDYRISQLTPEDLAHILSGTVTERTPEVVHGGKSTNVLLFWSGHGAYNKMLNWGDTYITSDEINTILTGAQPNFRKLFCVMETCYSGSVGENLPEIDGLLMLTACAPGEKSHADVIDGNIYLSNAFTRVFREEVEKNANITIYNLYTSLARHTTASHTMMYNYTSYGSVYTNTMTEFFNPQY
jgi:hypothetical protein